jgi:hypothetical protein
MTNLTKNNNRQWNIKTERYKISNRDEMLLFYKIVNKEAPDYLYELVSPLVAANVNNNLRSSHFTIKFA